jgi:outer membrane protein
MGLRLSALRVQPLVVCSALLMVGQMAPAQTKVGIINLQRAVLESAEIKAASAAMEARYKPRVSQIDQLDKEIAAIGQNLQSNAGKLTPQAEADLNAQAPGKQRDVQSARRLAGRCGARSQRYPAKELRQDERGGEEAGRGRTRRGVDQPYTVYFKAALTSQPMRLPRTTKRTRRRRSCSPEVSHNRRADARLFRPIRRR